MSITFQKRQKEMKRLEKQRAKAERRAQKKLVNREAINNPEEANSNPVDDSTSSPPHPEESTS